MALASALATAGILTESIDTDASVAVRLVDGVPAITKIELVTQGSVPGMDEDRFRQFAEAAKANCPVSRALAGVTEVMLNATLRTTVG